MYALSAIQSRLARRSEHPATLPDWRGSFSGAWVRMREWLRELLDSPLWTPGTDAFEQSDLKNAGHADRCDALRRMAHSSECESLWKSIERRCAARVVEYEQVTDGGIHDVEVTEFEYEAEALADCVAVSLLPEPYSFAATKSQRQSLTRDADKALLTLIRCTSNFSLERLNRPGFCRHLEASF